MGSGTFPGYSDSNLTMPARPPMSSRRFTLPTPSRGFRVWRNGDPQSDWYGRRIRFWSRAVDTIPQTGGGTTPLDYRF
jgi:hypothetical protein